MCPRLAPGSWQPKDDMHLVTPAGAVTLDPALSYSAVRLLLYGSGGRGGGAADLVRAGHGALGAQAAALVARTNTGAGAETGPAQGLVGRPDGCIDLKPRLAEWLRGLGPVWARGACALEAGGAGVALWR